MASVPGGLPCVAVVAALGCGGQPAPAASSPAPSAQGAPPALAVTQAPAPLTRARVAELLAPVQVTASAHNLVKNASFDGGKSLPWMTSFSRPAEGEAFVEGGAFCLDVTNAGKNVWDAQFRHREMTIQKGHKYSIRFKIAATSPTAVLAKIGMSGPPYKAYWQQHMELGAEPKVVTSEFTMTEADDPTAELAFHAGGYTASKQLPFDICVDDVVLEDPEFSPKPEAAPPPVPNVLVDQVGYLPLLAKIAIVKTDAAAPLRWELIDKSGKVMAAGDTAVHGPDAASGDHVHTADFSAFTTPGTGYTLRVGSDVSHPFDIGPAVYKKLKYDALHYFYHTRSGIPIVMPYAGDPKWTRPAGHPGDKSVACAPDAHCDYTLDVSGGWYDAGDHGKYVVNGGIATWTLVNLYERTKYLGSSVADFGDGKMNIPESHNGAPDLLDEARWELDFLMKMQVPEGKPLAGMAHHKIHDKEWTALATRPDQDPIERLLRPVSTAATLNLAAAAAQCARVFKGIDNAFSARCLQSAERAWTAAAANPAMFITSADTVGGGPYDDDDVSDEFYWAASELYLTTKKDTYKDFFMKSPHHAAVPAAPKGGDLTPMAWQNVAALGTISLAVVPNGLPKDEVANLRAAIVKTADTYAAIDRDEGYRVPFKPDSSGKYPWGSNSSILNNALLMGLAYDFTKDGKYLGDIEDAMSYVLGRNPLDQSFVTGYGFRPLQNPHHRFWAHQANAAFPTPPPGVLSGGPNSGLQDPYVKAAGLRGCAPMKCFADNIEAWSANEEAINWNAPLAWVAAFLDERPKPGAAAGAQAQNAAAHR
ncbi:MAG TPA: glycoside hydrolase family 9 protein [Polyangiaceae bacterium]|nr:glycoside hydrolase family 9 protein [Polyangiaceae bacterium]